MFEFIFGLFFIMLVALLSAVIFYALFEISKPIIKILLAILFIPFAIRDIHRKRNGTYNGFEDVFVGKS